jgi:hypothetical protein
LMRRPRPALTPLRIPPPPPSFSAPEGERHDSPSSAACRPRA